MTDTARCAWCERPYPHATLCPACVRTVAKDLDAIDAYARELPSKRALIGSRTYDAPTARSAERRLPIDPRATEAGRRALTRLAPIVDTWRPAWRRTSATHPVEVRLVLAAAFIRNRLDDVAADTDAARLGDDIRQARQTLETYVDVTASTAYLGICSADHLGEDGEPDGTVCPRAVYVEVDHRGRPEAAQVTCPACMTTHDVAARQRVLEDAVQDHLVTGAEAAALLTLLGETSTYRDVKYLWERGLVAPHGTITEMTIKGPRTARTYRLGDVIAARRRTRQSRRRAG